MGTIMATAKCFDPAADRAPRSHLDLVPTEPDARPRPWQWVWFTLQLLAIAALQFGDDVVRGNIEPPNVMEAIRNAHVIASIEQAHGLFVEPGVQLWVRHANALHGILSYANIEHGIDVVYALGQTLVPLGTALWIFLRHRARFPFTRNVAFLSTLLSLVGYEIYPTAPPRLASGLIYDHRAFHFQDTVQHVIGEGKLNGIPIGYNAYSAVPSLHIAWALIVAGSVVLLARHPLVRIIAFLYPFLMLFAVVASANHFLLDAVAGALTVLLAAFAALTLERWRAHLAPIRSEDSLFSVSWPAECDRSA